MALSGLKGIRFSFRTFLILFIPFLSTCQSKSDSEFLEISVIWKDEKPVAVSIPGNQLYITNREPIGEQFSIHITGHQESPVLGVWALEDSVIKFYPLVPFTPGTIYELYEGEQLLDSFKIEARESGPSSVVKIFPSSDTVPENLLKMYIRFSDSMREGEALQNIFVVELGSGDTLEGTFLALQPELWNEDNTLITLWLDPGRIKRGLIPNQEKGIPLHRDHQYGIIIRNTWRDAKGNRISRTHFKKIYVVERDSISPDPEKWNLKIPEKGSVDSFKIEFGEPLDAILANEALEIFDSGHNAISGTETVDNEETIYVFKPEAPWEAGNYVLQVETRLEDLAGNNINRLFDRDITNKEPNSDEVEFIEISFIIN